MAKAKWTDASDDKADRRARIKEDSARDRALDKKQGVPEDDRPKKGQQPGGTGRTTGVKLKPAVAVGAGVASRRQTSPQSLDGVGARVPNVISKTLPPNIQSKSKKKG